MFYKIEVAVAETAISFCNGYGETLHFPASPACRMDHVTEFCQWNIPKVLSLLLGLANENPSTVLPAFSLSPTAADCRERKYPRRCRATQGRETMSLDDGTEFLK